MFSTAAGREFALGGGQRQLVQCGLVSSMLAIRMTEMIRCRPLVGRASRHDRRCTSVPQATGLELIGDRR